MTPAMALFWLFSGFFGMVQEADKIEYCKKINYSDKEFCSLEKKVSDIIK